MVKTHVKTELSLGLFWLAQGGVGTDGWDGPSSRPRRHWDCGARTRSAHCPALVRTPRVVSPAESSTCMCLQIPPLPSLSPVSPDSAHLSGVLLLLLLQTVGITPV